jgi:hypothetical protein
MSTYNQKRTLEKSTQRACLDLLAAEGIWHRRHNTGAVNKGTRLFRFGQPGDGDVFFTLRGQLHWLEIKSSIGRQSEEQKLFQAEVECQGHVYLLIRDVDELRDWLKKHKGEWNEITSDKA